MKQYLKHSFLNFLSISNTTIFFIYQIHTFIRSILHKTRHNPLPFLSSLSNRVFKMSWQTYVDEHLMCDIEGQAGLRLAAAAIMGHDGAIWAQSANFPQVSSNKPYILCTYKDIENIKTKF